MHIIYFLSILDIPIYIVAALVEMDVWGGIDADSLKKGA